MGFTFYHRMGMIRAAARGLALVSWISSCPKRLVCFVAASRFPSEKSNDSITRRSESRTLIEDIFGNTAVKHVNPQFALISR
jgi:hypothetical protein